MNPSEWVPLYEALAAEFFAPEPHRSAGKPMRANNAFHDIAALYPEAGK